MSRRLRIAVAIPWLCVAAIAVAHAQQVPDEARGPQDPTRRGGIQKIETGKLPSDASIETAEGQRPPAWMTYAFFFKHLDNLERAADEQAALGNESAAAAWRAHEQAAAGLQEQEAIALKEVARACNQALGEKDVQIRAAATAFREQNPEGVLLMASVPPEVDVLWQERIQIVEQQVYQLRALLGEERFLALDSYVRANFTPVLVPAASAKGEHQ